MSDFISEFLCLTLCCSRAHFLSSHTRLPVTLPPIKHWKNSYSCSAQRPLIAAAFPLNLSHYLSPGGESRKCSTTTTLKFLKLKCQAKSLVTHKRVQSTTGSELVCVWVHTHTHTRALCILPTFLSRSQIISCILFAVNSRVCVCLLFCVWVWHSCSVCFSGLNPLQHLRLRTVPMGFPQKLSTTTGWSR